MEVADPNLLRSEMQTLETRGMHASLDSGQVVGVLGQKLSATPQRVELQFVRGNEMLMGGPGNLRIGQANQIEEVEEHFVGLTGMWAMPK